MKKLTKQQKVFADEYLIDLNGTRAYMVAYPRVKKKSTAAVNASNHLRKPNISAYIQAAMDARSKRTEITQDRVLKEYAEIAFFKLKKDQEVTISDKLKALQDIAKHLGMFDKKEEGINEESWADLLSELSGRLPE